MTDPTVPRVYADFNNADSRGRLRLNSTGTVEDLARQKVVPREGLVVDLYSDDEGAADELSTKGRLEYSQDEHVWVAVIDWASIRHGSDGGTNVTEPRKAS